MICPKCKGGETQVIDSRDTHEGIRRRRECLSCKHRFTTYERIEATCPVVVKKDGQRERFNPEKIRRGVTISCKNRPVTAIQIDDLVTEIEHRVCLSGEDEIKSVEVGDHVRALLKELDEVAYIRFVSVYQAFSDIDQFTKTVETLN